ncbi:AAA family ATPase [Aeromonas rivipollensis]|uniref:AAA family ATPase n=1 Tax=Aeromonas rivipollensis TaxID=948519 RepID=UPI003987F08A
MIFSLFLRNYKTYRGWNFIPVSNGEFFSAFVGENGVGKSSILEALDIYFNNPNSDWNYNHSVAKSGFSSTEPTICPVFIIPKKYINKTRNIYKWLEVVSQITWQLEFQQFNSSHISIANEFIRQLDRFKTEEKGYEKSFFIFPLAFEKKSQRETKLSLSIFNGVSDYNDDLSEQFKITVDDFIEEARSLIDELFEYIYIPSEIDFEHYTKIESNTTQSLMGTTVDEIVRKAVDEKLIKEINTKLDIFINEVSSYLEIYEYKKPAKKQTLFNLTHLSSKIIETYFESKVLNLNITGESTPIFHCSSGEKRKAIIDLARAFIMKSTDRRRHVILAIDEPEISLHTSSCFSQFEKLHDISSHNVQTLVATHWYGFMSAIPAGTATYIAEQDSEKKTYLIDLSRFREDIKIIKTESKGKQPSSIELKNINDLVQSIIASVTSENRGWIICEGSSDKRYIEHWLGQRNNINVISIGGSKYVKKLYEYFHLALEEDRQEIKGKIFCLLDTDKHYEKYGSKTAIKAIDIKRLHNCIDKNETTLKTTNDNNFFPPTEIEDCLEPYVFLQTFAHFAQHINDPSFQELSDKMKVHIDNAPAGLSLNLGHIEKKELERFFDLRGMKTSFSKKYCELDDPKAIPVWIDEVINFLESS